MKFLDTMVTFAEVPDEISLCINITNCPHKCEGCHSPMLQKDLGKVLWHSTLNNLIERNKGITCVCFMGGDKYVDDVIYKAIVVKGHNLKVAWYSGNDYIDTTIKKYLRFFDYIKIGHYDKDKGPLNSKTTNQRFYEIKNNELIDITYKFWK